jgi:Dehydrogenases with different specificities (related to short-chain alcohol dehydrogenases)
VTPILVVAGASRGLGRACTSFFLDAGWRVEGVSRGEAAIEHPEYSHARVDLLDAQAVHEWASSLRSRHGAIDALVCASGHMPVGALAVSTSSDSFVSAFQSNALTVFNSCREVAPLMIPRRYGRIVCISSAMTALHARGTVAYSASKSAATEVVRVLARELAPLGITCNAVAPGFVATESATGLGHGVEKAVIAQQSISRAITVREVCSTVQFLISPESSAITGQVIYLGLVT